MILARYRYLINVWHLTHSRHLINTSCEHCVLPKCTLLIHRGAWIWLQICLTPRFIHIITTLPHWHLVPNAQRSQGTEASGHCSLMHSTSDLLALPAPSPYSLKNLEIIHSGPQDPQLWRGRSSLPPQTGKAQGHRKSAQCRTCSANVFGSECAHARSGPLHTGALCETKSQELYPPAKWNQCGGHFLLPSQSLFVSWLLCPRTCAPYAGVCGTVRTSTPLNWVTPRFQACSPPWPKPG